MQVTYRCLVLVYLCGVSFELAQECRRLHIKLVRGPLVIVYYSKTTNDTAQIQLVNYSENNSVCSAIPPSSTPLVAESLATAF
jgi:hypothetical protein